MKDEDKRGRANCFHEAGQVVITRSVFIHGKITGIQKLDVGDVDNLDVGCFFQFAIAASALEFEHLCGGDAVDVVYKLAGVRRNVR